MEPLLVIIKYLFKKKGIINSDENLGIFFSNGISFPKFISLIFNVDSIPGIETNPASIQANDNNNIALQYLFQKNEKIKSINPNFQTEKNQITLMKLILTMQCFPANLKEIIDKTNMILKQKEIKIKSKNDLTTLNTLSSVLNILTDGFFPISDNLEEIIQNSEKINAPLFINENCFDRQNSFIFLIQIQIIFDVYSEKINQILNPDYKGQQSQDLEHFLDFMSDIPDDENEQKNEQNNSKESELKNEQNNSKENDEEEEEEEEFQESESLDFKKHLHLLKNNVDQLVENLKNFIKIDTVYDRIQAEQTTSLERLWNLPVFKYEYDNGILYIEKPKISLDNIIGEYKKLSNDNCQSPILYKIMIYNEQKYHWQFCESEFEKCLTKTDENIKVPLVLFLDTNLNDISNIFLTVNNNLNYQSNEDISVLSFRKNLDDELLFLYVHVPENKKNHKNIGTILYQIYTFLFLICDLNVVVLDKKYTNPQILAVSEIIKISNNYIKKAKNEDKPNPFLNKSKILFLQFTNNDNTPSLEKFIKPRIKKEYTIKCVKNENEFFPILNEIVFNQCYNYTNLLIALKYTDSIFSEISSLYLYMRKEKNIYNLIKSITMKCFIPLNTDPKNSEKISSILHDLENESRHYFPKNEEFISSILNMVFLDISLEFIQSDKEILKTKLEEQSKANLDNLIKEIHKKKYWNQKQIYIIKRSHIDFLRKKFLEIIKDTFQSPMIDIIFEKNFDILESQIKEDQSQLEIIFKSYINNIIKKQSVVDDDFENESKKGTNYVMREVETTREVEVIVEAGEELDTVIQTDF